MALVNGMVKDENGGVCIRKVLTYYSYVKSTTGCDCTDSVDFYETETPIGLYVTPYININPNYSINTEEQSLCLIISSGTTITTWFETYINDLATTGYTSDYDNSEYETRVLYEQLTGDLYKAVHDFRSTNCTFNTAAMWAIYDTVNEEVWQGVGDYYFNELDGCGEETGKKIVRMVDINENSTTYNQIKDVVKC